jgi:hypothetical protein
MRFGLEVWAGIVEPPEDSEWIRGFGVVFSLDRQNVEHHERTRLQEDRISWFFAGQL